ncbi:hypothetical protein PQJ75_04580 [Rhodoplanes sp. TEM]|uniref:Aminotransferase class I/classII domain-containing protein n=1 Tax=Rhodoplanes tepidamans TaxID=200616 RepID=A0ABT5JAE3_RHOTP|nr:hypothetical protein [Rhodoplanes sp. TEM]MDC7786658.1 hypothetical protein [Rhodoplanes tepidamans]MDC7982995.1 hypothetical protein [Rhodoplanes sp. TEM]
MIEAGNPNRGDPDRWRPLIMSFSKVYGLAAGPPMGSTLSRIPQDRYRSPDVDAARAAPVRSPAA